MLNIFFSKKKLELEIEKKKLELEIENFNREKTNIAKELELKYQFDRREIEDQWHCKLGNYIEKAIKEEREKTYQLLEKAIDIVGKINHENKIEIIK